MPFISSYAHSFYSRSLPLPVWVPDSSTEGLSFWIDANDRASYTEYYGNNGIQTVTDKAGGNAITINNSGNVNDDPPKARDQQNGLPSSMHVFEFSGESFTTGQFAQVDSNGNHFSIALVRAGNDGPSNPYASGFNSFWTTESNLTTGRRDYGLEQGNATYFYGQLSLDSLNPNNRVNNDDVVQYGGIWGDPNVDTEQGLLRFDGFGGNTQYRGIAVWFIMAIVFNKTGNQILVRIDGENTFTPVDYDNSLNTNLSLRIAVNRTHDNNDKNMFTQVGELMTFAAPPGTGGTDMSDVERLEGYLAHKWGLDNLLPNAHPYKYQYPVEPRSLEQIALDNSDAKIGIDVVNSAIDHYGYRSTLNFASSNNPVAFNVTATTSTAEGIDVVNGYEEIMKFDPTTGNTSFVLARFSNGTDHAFDPLRLTEHGYSPSEGYTLEAWIYPSDNTYTPGTNNIGYQIIIDTRGLSGVGSGSGSTGHDNPILTFMGGTTGDQRQRIYAGSSTAARANTSFNITQDLRSGVTSVPYGQWTHVAYTIQWDTTSYPHHPLLKNGRATRKIYINGVLDGQEIETGIAIPASGRLNWSDTLLGMPATAQSTNDYNDTQFNNELYRFKGYMQNARVSHGVKYINNFTPPNLRDDIGSIANGVRPNSDGSL